MEKKKKKKRKEEREKEKCPEFLIERNPHAPETWDIGCKVHISK